MTAEQRLARRVKAAKSIDEAIAICERVLSAKRNGIKRPLAPGTSREERRAERKTRAAEIRASVMKRAEAQGGCEWCPPLRKSLHMTLEWHHCLGGGARTAREAEENTAGICWDCHRGWERSNLDVLRAALEWAIGRGFSDALRVIEKRIQGAEESRRTVAIHTEETP